MNREEILEKNKKDNCIFDEMNVYNSRVENENAYLCLKIILIILYITFSNHYIFSTGSFFQGTTFSHFLGRKRIS